MEGVLFISLLAREVVRALARSNYRVFSKAYFRVLSFRRLDEGAVDPNSFWVSLLWVRLCYLFVYFILGDI